MKNIQLVTLGCSWTAQFSKSVSPWPDVIGKENGWEVTNYGQPGAGNKFALDRLLVHILKGDRVDKVYWLLTQWDRFDITVPNKPYPVTIKPYSQQNPLYKEYSLKFYKHFQPEYTEKELDEHASRIDRKIKIGRTLLDCNNMQHMVDTNLYYILSVQKLCKELDIDLKIIQGMRPIQTTGTRELHHNILKSSFNKDLDHYIGYPFYNIEDSGKWTEDKWINSEDSHPGPKGAEYIAELFSND